MFFQLTVGVLFFLWLTLGLIWRFSAAGKVASAERLLSKFEEEQTKMVNRDKPTGKLPETAGYQVHGGQFISDFYYYVFPTLFFFSLTAALVVLHAKPPDSDFPQEDKEQKEWDDESGGSYKECDKTMDTEHQRKQQLQ